MKAIYIVEDDDGIRELTHYLLEGQGYKVKSFANVENFRSQLAIKEPDLVLLDICLPDGDGREVCREIREMEEMRKFPVVLMSANTSPSTTDVANDFIPKPFDIDDLLRRIERLL